MTKKKDEEAIKAEIAKEEKKIQELQQEMREKEPERKRIAVEYGLSLFDDLLTEAQRMLDEAKKNSNSEE